MTTRITQTATVLVALMVALSIFGGVGTVAAQDATVEQSASAVTAAPGETVELTTTFSTEDITGHGVQVILPTDWQGTMTDADGGAPNSPSGSPNVLEVVWLTAGTQTYEITYEIDVPGDAEPDDYTVGVEGSGINPDDDTQVLGSTETTITVEEPSQNEPPAASFTHSPIGPQTGEQVSFDASGSGDDSAIANYEWDFDGDGTSDATGETTTTSFDSEGDYDVTLTVTDDDGETDTATQTISVADAPVAPGSGIGVSLEPSASTITEGESDEFDIVVSNLEGSSVGAYDITLALSNGGVATFDGVEVDGESIDGDDSDLTDVIETGDAIRIEVAGQSVAGAEAVIGTVNVSGDAPGEVDISVQEALVYDESGDGYEIGATEGVGMTVEELQEPFFEVSSLDAPDEVAQGDDITVTATVTNTGELTGIKTVSFEFDGATVDSEDVELDPGASADVSFTVSSGEISAGTYTHGVVTEDGNATAEIVITPPALGEFETPPQDLDGDGLYEDVNGDDEFDMGDAQALFANRNTEAVQNNAAAFDFNGDEVVDVGDVQALFDQLI